MSDNKEKFDFFVTSFFSQDVLSQDVASFCFRNVWIYFFRETIIGCVNLDTDELYVLNAKTKLPDNNFTSQHLITEKMCQEVVNDHLVKTEPKYLEFKELNIAAFEMMRQQLSATIDWEAGIG